MKRGVLPFFCLSLVGGCVNTDVSDLRQYVQEVKKRPKGAIKPLPETKVAEAFIFDPEGIRDPFRPVEKSRVEETLGSSVGSGVVPDVSRRKEELEAYPLDTLQMVGTLISEKELWGLIRAGDGTIHRVRKGSFMGQNYGEISRILSDKVELIEIVPDKPGVWVEQQSSLALIE
jgi:type IV pilus assembly protein PilP